MIKTKSRKSDLDVAIGQYLKSIRASKGLSQGDIGQILGVSIQQIQKYESGLNRVSLASFITLHKALNLDFNDFLALDTRNIQSVDVSTTKLKNFQAIAKLLEGVDTDVLSAIAKFLKVAKGGTDA